MARITRKQLDYLEQALNRMLGRPVETFTDTGRWQLGNVHLQAANGYYNVHEVYNDAGGVKALAEGLSGREAAEWLRGAIAAARLINGTHPGR
jgi:hypothetical protein